VSPAASAQTPLSRGFLPLSALRGREPTSVALVDLEAGLGAVSPQGDPLEPTGRDCLVLVRRRDDPIATVHLDRDPASISPPELRSELRRLIGDEFESRNKNPDAASRASTGSGAVILSTTGGDLEQLGRCLASLRRQRHEDFEVLVIDNRPARKGTRALVEELAAEDPRVRYVSEPRAGLSVARNRGLTATDADFVAFTDDDVVVDPHWLDWLLSPFADPTVAATCGMVLPFELETEAQKRFERYLGFSRGVERQQHDLQTGLDAEIPFYPFLADIFGSGNSMAFRREELLGSGGFDPALGAGSPTHAGEETDAFSRAILRGGRIVYEPRALSWHQHRRDDEALREQIFGYGVGVGALVSKALTHDARFHRAASRQLLPLRTRAIAPSAGRRDPRVAGADDSSGELLKARRSGIVQGPLRYAQALGRARKLGLWRMNPGPGRAPLGRSAR
jgi:GT2 family glycosyltransferase